MSGCFVSSTGSTWPRDTLQRRFTLVRGSAAWAVHASSSGFLRLGVAAQLRRDDTLRVGSAGPFPETVTGSVGPYLMWNRAHFIVTKGYAGFAREEDVDVGLTLRVGLHAAPKLFGYERDGLGPEVSGRVGAQLPGGFAYLDALADGLYTSAGLDSGSVQIGGTVVLQPAARHVAVFHLEGGWLKNPVPGEEFDLGLGSGPRAFGSHAFTGDRSIFGIAEYRYTVVDDLGGMVGLGIAGFVDHGGAWYAGSPRRMGWDAGIGLRVGASRSSDTPALRFDLARRFANDVDKAGLGRERGQRLPLCDVPVESQLSGGTNGQAVSRLLDRPAAGDAGSGVRPEGLARHHAARSAPGVTPEEALWRPAPGRHNVWELTLHTAYWKYAVRRRLAGAAIGSFDRKPSDWPAIPDPPTCGRGSGTSLSWLPSTGSCGRW